MTPAARIQSAIEILDLVIAAACGNGPPADRILSDYFRTRRYAGSKDRRAVREWVYVAIRACDEVPESGRAAMLALTQHDAEMAALFNGSPHCPAVISPEERPASLGLAPAWLTAVLAQSGIVGLEAGALLERAPLDIRVNALKAERASLALPVAAEPLPTPHGLRLPAGTPVEAWDAFQSGLIEVQDCGSQIASMAVAARPGELVIDLCAGAGGKSLALAADMNGQGKLIACDTDRGRLSRLAPRAERAGAMVIETLLLNPGKEAAMLAHYHHRADAVLVDAPCSGTGTWRRNPEGRWRLTPSELRSLAQLQARLLDIGAGLVRPGGRLIYAVCSLLDTEGARQMDSFMARHDGWRAEPLALPLGTPRGDGLRLSPHHDGTDGFFIAQLVRL